MLWLAHLKAGAAFGVSQAPQDGSRNSAIGAIRGVARVHQGVLYFQNVTTVSRYTQ